MRTEIGFIKVNAELSLEIQVDDNLVQSRFGGIDSNVNRPAIGKYRAVLTQADLTAMAEESLKLLHRYVLEGSLNTEYVPDTLRNLLGKMHHLLPIFVGQKSKEDDKVYDDYDGEELV